jgi:ubiquinone/menaquinone biosynthesis C-methylase UbiE
LGLLLNNKQPLNVDDPVEIKRKKGDFWAAPGAAEVYDRNAFAGSGLIQIKNQVERCIVLKNAAGKVLDAGTGTGRFAIPLARGRSNTVVALDYSMDMLLLNRRNGVREGLTSIHYVRGDVERLPFHDNEFDCVVSITVVRHFPQWRDILKEYVRVVRPGGRIVFEMCSGDHINAANRLIKRFGARYRQDDYLSYEAEVPYLELKGWLDEQGVDVVSRHTYDFLNSNCFLKLVTLVPTGYRLTVRALGLLFRWTPLQRMAVWLELRVLGGVSTSLSYNYMIVASKR